MKKIILNVVLVRPLYPLNIGATARAMTNMGGQQLILIAPQCEVDYSSQQAAASGQRPLSQRIVYSSMEEFYKNEPEGIRIAFTARDGRGRATFDFETKLTELAENHPSFTKESSEALPVYLIFGPEDCGLSFEDLEHSHYACNIPTYGENWSLNLAQAVLLALFITRRVLGGERTHLDGEQKPRARINTSFADESLKVWLETLGMDLSKKKINAYTVLRRMILHNVPTLKEIRIFETVVQQTIRKLKEAKELESKNKN